MKRNVLFWLVLGGMATVLLILILPNNLFHQKQDFLKIGVAVYNLDDSFMESMTTELEASLETQLSTDIPIRYEIVDAQGNETKQEEQIQYFMNQDCDLLLLNLVRPASAASVLNQAASGNIPVILFNREPNQADMEISANIWYVGTDGQATGKLQAEMLQQAWQTRKSSIDKNQNGKIDYILIEGEATHYDTIRRTDAFLEETSTSLPMNQMADLSGDWMRQTAYDEVETLTDDTISSVEAIVCNNDDMALGVYDFYKKKGLTCPLLIGSNKNEEMQRLIDAGEIYGTVDINTKEQVQNICDLIHQITCGQTPKQKVWYCAPIAYSAA